MSYSLSDSRLLNPLFGDAELQPLFRDAAQIKAMIRVEQELAKVQGELGIIEPDLAAAIVTASDSFQPDWPALEQGTEKAGVPVSELVRQLRQHVGEPAASFVHWGATTQDILDTAAVLQFRSALTVIEGRLEQLIKQLARLADTHRYTIMAGRTHSQQALPITFGLKVAGWLAPLLRHHQRLTELRPRFLVLQFGGGAGTLAALGAKGPVVQQALAESLDLNTPTLPWHTQRDAFLEAAGWLTLVSGSLAKMAQDIILLAQTEIGELRESADDRRGGSSTMPQKSNPVISEAVIAIARTNAARLAALHQAAVQEHERGTHGWQIEWLNLPHLFVLTGAALNKALFLSQNLVINDDRMRRNVSTSQGLMLAEALSLALAPSLGRTAAKALVAQACQQALAEQRHLVDVVREQTTADLDWAALRKEANYLGATQTFIDQVIQQAKNL